MGYDHGGIAHLTAKGAAGRTGLSQAASGRALRRLEEADLIIGDGDGDAWRTSAGIFARAGDASPEAGQDIVPETAGAGTEIVGAMPGRPLPPPVAALMEQFGMTEADVLALAMGGPAGDFSIPDEVYVGGNGVAAGFGEEVAAEAEHVRPAAEGAVGGLAAHAAVRAADGPAGVDEPFGVGAGWVGVEIEGVGGDVCGGVAGGLGAFGGVLGEVRGGGQPGDRTGSVVGKGADIELVTPGDEPAFAVGAVGVRLGAEGDARCGLADGVLEVGGGDAVRRDDDRGGVLGAGAVEAEQGVEVDRAACLVFGGLAVGQAYGRLVFPERGRSISPEA
jgi:hypothetical protein